MVDNIVDTVLVLHIDSEFEVSWSLDPRASHIELAMGEDLIPEPDCCHPECLTLRLVDGHCEGWPHRELSPLPAEGILIDLRDEADPGDEDNPARGHDGALQDPVVDGLPEQQPGPITETLPWIDVPQQHQWSPRFDPDHVRREAIGGESVEVLCVEPVQVLTVLQGVS